MPAVFDHCERLVREGDMDRFLAALFASPERRPLLHAVYAFDIEIAAIGLRVHEPLAGEVRLQWWRDVIAGERPGEAAASPVAAALLAAIDAAGLDRAPFLAALDARSFDVHREAMPTLEELRRYAADAAGSVMRAAAAVLGADDGGRSEDLLADASLAVTAAGALRQFARQASRGRLLVPTEVLDRHGVDPGEVLAGRTSPALHAALAEFGALARRHARRTMAQLAEKAPAAAWPAFLHVGLVPLYLDRMERGGYDPFATALDVPQWRRQWRLWRLARSLREPG
ncbi:MAG: squalene/phytoene synthase family protein [Variibacter sp.]|nr:squalene/phytoene synthase family protein [Variibacter sp.]